MTRCRSDVNASRSRARAVISFEDFRAQLKGRQGSADDFVAFCPAHSDREHRSLHVTRAANGGILAKCFVGCAFEKIISATTVSATTNGNTPRNHTVRLTLEEFAAAKGLTVEILIANHVKQTERGLRITYLERDGVPARQQRSRTHAIAKEGSSWIKDAGSPIPYGRWRLDEAVELGELLVVEGETDTLTGWAHNVPTLGIPGADMVKILAADDLRAIERLYIVEEPDQGGTTFVARMAERLGELSWRGSAFVVTLPVKDLNELHQVAGDDFAEQLLTAKTAARPIADVVSTSRRETPESAATPLVEAGTGENGPILVSLADVAPESVEWLWPDRIARGKLALVIGEPGEGKSFMTHDLAARTTRGLAWPDAGTAPAGAIIILASEDGLADTVRPRIDRQDGDVRRISVLRAVRVGGRFTSRTPGSGATPTRITSGSALGP